TTTTTTTTTVASTTVPSSTTTVEKKESSSEELINLGERPSWLDLSVFADNHRSLITTTTEPVSTTTTTEVPTTTSTEPPPKEILVMQAFAAAEKKRDELKEAQEKKMKESEFGGNVFDEIAERGDHDRFSTAAPPPPRSSSRTFALPPVPPLPTIESFGESLDIAPNSVTRRPRDQSVPPKAPSLQQERLPKAFRALVEDLENEAVTEMERKQLTEQLKLEAAQQPMSRVKPRPVHPTTTTGPSISFLDGALTNEIDQFFGEQKESETAEEKIRKSGRVHQKNSTVAGHRRRVLKGRRKLNRQQQEGGIAKSRIVRTQKRLVLVPEEEEIGKWVESQERGRLSKLPQAAQPPVKGAGRTTPSPVFSIGDPAKMRTTPSPLQAIPITSRPYYNVNSRTHVQQLQPQPDGTFAVRQLSMEDLSDGPEHVKPLIKPRRAIVEPRLPLHTPSHTGSSNSQSSKARDYERAMQRIASQIADKMFPSTKQPQEVQPIRSVPLALPRHTIRIGKKASSSVPLAVKRTVDSGRISSEEGLRFPDDPRTIDPRTARVRNRRNKHVVGISKRRRFTQGQVGAAAGRRRLTVVHADPSLPVGAIEVPGLIRGERAVHDGERFLTARAAPSKPPVLHHLVVDRNYDRQTIDRDIRL
ncbi:hypothetical protein PENTCL1PPCAC_7467, partial [Pristionchus entomophagus]